MAKNRKSILYHQTNIQKDHSDILHYFLNIYKKQMNVSGSTGEFYAVARPDENPDTIYEFRIKRRDRWHTRRISLGPLGEDTGSKSKCYKVIYDELLVLKIPPKAVRAFRDYMESIGREREIAELLEPEIDCITPSVSAVLKKLPLFSPDAHLGTFALEKKCVEKLRAFPEYQNYLKIADKFVFFSNLSRNLFLGQIIRDMHFGKTFVFNEIISHTEMLDHPLLFEEIYGKSALPVFYPICELYARFDAAVSALFGENPSAPLTSYRKKNWFLSRLAEKEAERDTAFPSSEEMEKINGLMTRILSSAGNDVRNYRNAVENRIRTKQFEQNKAGMRGIIRNLLLLLATLRAKGVAVRDLKPDNVFISGDISQNPVLLARPDEFSIGLIDFETAVFFSPPGQEKIRQPMLAGTPSYATPSHLFKNELLRIAYDDLNRILHLQDWQAVNSMIFNVVAGRRLTKKSGKLITGMAGIVRESLARKMTKIQAFQNCNRIFWNRASQEFYERSGRYKEYLQDVIIMLPEEVRIMFKTEAVCTEDLIRKRTACLLQSQTLFRSAKSRTALLNMDRDDLARYRCNWENNICVPPAEPRIRLKILRLLEIVDNLKLESGQVSGMISRIKQRGVSVSAYEIMLFMFRVVLNAMYRPEWGILSDDRPRTGAADFTADIPDDVSVGIEQTLL